MTTEEFYAQALLAALPVAVEKSPFDARTGKSKVTEFAHEYAALLTDTFQRNRKTYQQLA
jgi:hypothetical protein